MGKLPGCGNDKRRFRRHGSGIRWQGQEPLGRQAGQGLDAIGVPSTELSLGWMLASRANLRFTRREGNTGDIARKQEQPEVAGQDARQNCSEETLFFCPKNGVHLTVALALTVMLRNFWPGAKPMGVVTATKSHAGKDTIIHFAAGSIPM